MAIFSIYVLQHNHRTKLKSNKSKIYFYGLTIYGARMEFYRGYKPFLFAIDCVVFGYEDGELKLLLYPRGFEPVKGSWSLIGGFIQSDETSEEAALRVLKQITGLSNVFPEQVYTFTRPDRETTERVISIAYFALIKIDQHDKELIQEHGAKWWPVTRLPELIFDHPEMVEKSLARLQQKAGISLVGSELLPEKFTLIQLRKLYEAIYQREFDPGNFRKKILSLDILERLNIKDVSESKRGAFYYRVKANKGETEIDRIVKY